MRKTYLFMILIGIVYLVGVYFLFFYTTERTVSSKDFFKGSNLSDKEIRYISQSLSGVTEADIDTLLHDPVTATTAASSPDTAQNKLVTAKVGVLVPLKRKKLTVSSYTVPTNAEMSEEIINQVIKESRESKKSATDTFINRSLQIAKPSAVSGALYKVYITPDVSKTKLQKALTSFRIAERPAQSMASKFVSWSKTIVYKRILVVATAAAVTYTVEEYLFPEMHWGKKLYIALGVGLLLLGLYIVLVDNEIMT